MTVKHHLAIVEVPEEAGVAVAFSAILPVTVELLAGAVQATVGSSAALEVLAKPIPKPIARAETARTFEILMG